MSGKTLAVLLQPLLSTFCGWLVLFIESGTLVLTLASLLSLGDRTDGFRACFWGSGATVKCIPIKMNIFRALGKYCEDV